MGWLVLGVWIGAVALSALVLGFCAYELSWKGKRLKSDLDRLSTLTGPLNALQADLQTAQRRAADVGH